MNEVPYYLDMGESKIYKKMGSLDRLTFWDGTSSFLQVVLRIYVNLRHAMGCIMREDKDFF